MKRARKITKKDIKEIAKKYDLGPIEIQDIVNDMESDGIRVTKEDINDMYIESRNDEYKGYSEVATQKDFDLF